MGRAATFDSRQKRAAFDAYRIAEDLAGDHFALGAFDDDRHPVALCTLSELDEREVVPSGVLAHVTRYDEAAPASVARTLYRVCVQDHAILERLAAEEGRLHLFPLLLYVLTHELVHVARFLRHQIPYLLPEDARLEEELRVHAITRRILRDLPVPGLGDVLRFWG